MSSSRLRRYFSFAAGISILMAGVDLWARAGGSGGGGSGGGGGGGGYHGGGGSGDANLVGFILLVVIKMIEAGPIGWIVLAFLGYCVFLSFRYYYADGVRPMQDLYTPANLMVEESLRRKVETAFLTVQKAWSEKRPGLMRRFITDGVYQRFNAQFTMMNLLGQTNVMSNVKIHSIQLVPRMKENNGVYEALDLRIEASANDQFVSTLDPRLNSPGGREHFVEYWSFIRRKGANPATDIFNSNLCPRCQAPLGLNMMAEARCSYCGSYINNGEFDWVLSEITQEADYQYSVTRVPLPPAFDGPDSVYSVQVIEDKASNAFMQILTASATGNVEAVRRFSVDAEYEMIKRTWMQNRVIYDRLFLNSATVQKIEIIGDTYRAFVLIRYTFHPSTSSSLVGMDTRQKMVVLVHRPTSQPSKGTIYANACPTCGAPQKDSRLHVCQYCNSNLNDITRDWIVGGIT